MTSAAPVRSQPVNTQEPPRVSTRTWTRVAAGAAAVAVVCTGGYYGWSSLRSTTVSGASTPTAAADRLISAVSHKDPIAVVDSLEPDETAGLAALVKEARARSAAAGETKQGHELQGITLQLAGVHTSVTQLSKRVARVTITAGDATVDVENNSLSPLLKALIPQDYHDHRYDARRLQADVPFTLSLMTVDDGGNGWFVSPDYTVGSAIAQARGVVPTYSDTMPSVITEPTPDAAVSDFITALGAGGSSLTTALSRVDPAEQAAARDFAPVWQPITNQWAENDQWPQVQTQLSSMSDKKLPDGQVAVEVDSASGSWETGNGVASFVMQGAQLQVQSEGEDDDSSSQPEWALSQILSLGRWDMGESTGHPERLMIDTVKLAGGYAVDLVGTVTATESTAVTGWSTSDLLSMIGAQPQTDDGD